MLLLLLLIDPLLVLLLPIRNYDEYQISIGDQFLPLADAADQSSLLSVPATRKE